MPGVTKNALGLEGTPVTLTSDSVSVYGSPVDLINLSPFGRLAFQAIASGFTDTGAIITFEGSNSADPTTGIWTAYNSSPIITITGDGGFAVNNFLLAPLRWIRAVAILDGGTSPLTVWVSIFLTEAYN